MTDTLASEIRSIKLAFNPGDGRRDALELLAARAEKTEHDLNEWERGDVAKANRLMADRCVNAEHIARDAVARAEKAEAALRDMEAARDEQTRMKMETCRALDKERDAAEAKVATARAVMAEEAARKSESYGEIGMRPAREIRALAPLPAGLVVLSVEVVANARVELLEAHGRAERCECDKPCSTCATIAALDAAGGATK